MGGDTNQGAYIRGESVSQVREGANKKNGWTVTKSLPRLVDEGLQVKDFSEGGKKKKKKAGGMPMDGLRDREA